MGKISELAFEITLPDEAGRDVEFRDALGETWSHPPPSLDPTLTAEALWRQIENDWSRREGRGETLLRYHWPIRIRGSSNSYSRSKRPSRASKRASRCLAV